MRSSDGRGAARLLRLLLLLLLLLLKALRNPRDRRRPRWRIVLCVCWVGLYACDGGVSLVGIYPE
jgi:hypothetical protein